MIMEEDNLNRNPKFKTLKGRITQTTLGAIKAMGFKHMTDVQADVLPKALRGADIVATAKTGSGKTLAFLIPLIETVNKHLEIGKQGTCCIVISPTRELAIQTNSVLQDIISYYNNITSAIVIGGENRNRQTAELEKGVNIVVATPGRLFDHMRSKEFDYKEVKCLVLDEADKIFQYGFEEDLRQIVKRLPSNRQTMLFSATQSERTQALVESAMRGDVHFINTNEDNLKATVDGLKQGYVLVDTEYRLWWLHKLLKKTQKLKIMVFFSSCKSVIFHQEFFSTYCQLPVLGIHGKMNQYDRTATINDFYNAEKVALFCTDLAARGLDIPAVDWIVQFDPPADANEYIHRVGRTARGVGAAGNAVLLLRPEELEFVTYLQDAKIYLDKYEAWDKLSNLQPKLEAAFQNEELKKMAIDAFEGYIRALEVKKQKHIFNVIAMDMDTVARSFGLKEKPEIDIRVGFSKKHRPRKRAAATLAAKEATPKHIRR